MGASAIAAGTRPAQISPLGGGNPMGMMMDMMRFRQGMQEYNARQSFGNVVATSPDTATAIQRYSQDPNAGFFPEGLTQLRQMQLQESALQTQELERGKITSETAGLNIKNGMDVAKYSLGMAINDPDRLPEYTEDLIKYLPKEQQAEARTLLNDRNSSLLDGLPSDPTDRMKAFWLKSHGQLVASGMDSGQVYGARGLIPPTAETGPFGPGGAQQAVPAFGYPAPSGAGMPVLGQGSTVPGATTTAPAPGAGNMLGGYNVPTGPTQTMTKEQEQRGTDLAEYRDKLDSSVDSGAGLMQNIAEAREMMSAFQPGPGAGKYAEAAQIASALGARPELVNAIAHGDLSAAQTFQKLAATQIMGQLDASLPKGSRVNMREYSDFKASNPNIEMLPDAINRIFDFWSRTYIRNRIEQSSLQSYLKGGGDMDGWPAKWQQIQGSKGLLKTHLTGTKDGKDVGIDPMAVLHLLDNPDTAKDFDSHYGAGSSAKYIGN